MSFACSRGETLRGRSDRHGGKSSPRLGLRAVAHERDGAAADRRAARKEVGCWRRAGDLI